MHDITIRRAEQTDIPELSRLWLEKTTLQQQFDRRFLLAVEGRAAWERRLREWLADPACAVLVGAAGETLSGYIIGWVQDAPPGLVPARIGAVTDLALDAHRYQGGAGRALVKALRAWLSEQGIEHLVVYAPFRGAVEQAFWRSMGATEWVDVMWLT